MRRRCTTIKRRWKESGAIRCLEQVAAVDEKYGLPKLAENKARLSRLRTVKKTDPFRKPT